MAHTTDIRYADEMGLTAHQVRRMIRTLDIPFLASGRGETRTYLFARDDIEEAMIHAANVKKKKRQARKAAKNQA